MREHAAQTVAIETEIFARRLSLKDLRELVERTATWSEDLPITAIEGPASARISVSRPMSVSEEGGSS